MKKSLLMFAASMMVVVCFGCDGNKAENGGEGTDSAATEQVGDAQAEKPATNPFPWDFPQDVKLDAEVGQLVLAPYTFYGTAVEEGKDLTKTVLIFYKTTVQEVGEKTSKLDGHEVPNALIIPLEKDAKAKKGDILLTWWQKGSGLQRAIVTDASDPAAPKVNYLDLGYNPEGNGIGDKHADQQLKPGTFTVLKDGEWQPGAQVACRTSDGWAYATLIRVEGDKVLTLGFSDKVAAYNKADVKIIPFKENINVGDNVWAISVTTYNDGYTVTKVDANKGLVTVQSKSRPDKPEIKTISEVTKVLQ